MHYYQFICFFLLLFFKGSGIEEIYHHPHLGVGPRRHTGNGTFKPLDKNQKEKIFLFAPVVYDGPGGYAEFVAQFQTAKASPMSSGEKKVKANKPKAKAVPLNLSSSLDV